MSHKLWLWTILFGIFLSIGQGAAALSDKKSNQYHINLLIRPTPPNDFLTQLLRETLEASKQPGEDIQIEFNDRDLSQARWLAELQKNKHNDLIWTITTKERESFLRPIKIPLMRGLYGYRLLVIRPESATQFAQVNSLADLRELTAGLNVHWPDADIFHENGLPTTDGTFASNLYRMLSAQRFDYFPRGALEITEEQPLIDQFGLTLEKTLVIYYPSELYFFVSKDNTELAQRLEKGLAILIASGRFDQLFYSHPAIIAALRAIKERRIITIENHSLPNDTQQFPPAYYYAQPAFRAIQQK